MTKVVIAQLGSREDYSIPIALQNLGYLEQFYTDIYLYPWETKLLSYFSFLPPVAQLLSRHNQYLNANKVVRFNSLGFNYRQALREAKTSIAFYRSFIDYGSQFNQAILHHGFPEITHLYGFDHAALDLFAAVQPQGIRCILNQIYPALYHEQLEAEEEEIWPHWSKSLRTPLYQSSIFEQWREIQFREWELADTIVVNSEYSKRAIASVAPKIQPKLQIIPLTVNLNPYFLKQRVRHFPSSGALKVLFVGRVNLCKGIPYLLQAFAYLDRKIAQLKVVGSIDIKREAIAPYQDRVHFQGPVPHGQMPQIYHDADLLIFPTISDGFGAVMLEAMATGLPVIATDNCGDLVEDGVNGYRIPIRESEAIVAKIDHLRQQPQLLKELSQGAMATSQRYNIEAYQSKLAQIFQQDLND